MFGIDIKPSVVKTTPIIRPIGDKIPSSELGCRERQNSVSLFLLFISLCLFSARDSYKNEPVISRYDIANGKELDAGQLGGTDRNPYFDITQSLSLFLI